LDGPQSCHGETAYGWKVLEEYEIISLKIEEGEDI
jgi:hypothetical protein